VVFLWGEFFCYRILRLDVCVYVFFFFFFAGFSCKRKGENLLGFVNLGIIIKCNFRVRYI
jgi:hypothetical protein